MKNNGIKLISITLSFVILLSSMFTLTIGATEENDVAPTFLNTPASFYFSALNTNFGKNARNSCGYLAVSMLLSYYDHYWNDDIIPNSHNKSGSFSLASNTVSVLSSPGVYKDPWSLNTYFYDSLITTQGPERYLHLELLRLGRDELEFTPTQIPTDPNADDDDDLRWVTNDEMLVSLLNYYFQEYLSLRGSDGTTNYVTVHSDTYENYPSSAFSDPDGIVRRKMIEKIKAGIPVIYNASTTTGIGHSFIAYDYDVENDAVYLHCGLDDSNDIFNNFYISDKDPNFTYTENISCVWVEIDETKLSHEHSLFYENTADGSDHCMCEFHDHIAHNHTGEYINTGSTTTHNRNCNWCGVVAENHFVSDYGRYTEQQHKTFCECGARVGYAPHVVSTGGIGIKICIYCGEDIDTGFTTLIGILGTTPSIRYITDAGSYVDSDGIIYLVESDMNLLLSGELDVYELAENNLKE